MTPMFPSDRFLSPKECPPKSSLFRPFDLALLFRPFFWRFLVPVGFMLAGRVLPESAAARLVRPLAIFSFSRKASMSPYSTSLSSMNCADLYTSFSFSFFSFRLLRTGSSAENSSPSGSGEGDRLRLLCRFFLINCEAFLPSRSIGF